MATMFVQMGLYGAGAALLVYLIYALFFSGHKQKTAEAPPKAHRRFERREGETGDRRRSDSPGELLDGVDRRKGGRRSRD